MTKKKDPKDHLPAGRPSEFRAEYCDLLISHMKSGGSLEAFAAKIPCAIQTLYNWLDAHPEFLEARKAGMGHLTTFYEDLGKMMAAGQLKFLKSEKPMLDEKGKPVLHPVTGQVMMHREYDHVTGSPAAWIFLTKNLLGWRDKKDIQHSGKDGGPISFANLSDDDLRKELERLQQEAKKFLKK